MSTPAVSVVLPTRNPHEGRLARTLAGLARQQMPAERFEVLLVDNGSEPPLAGRVPSTELSNLRLVREPEPGLTPARLRGLAEARAPVVVFVDDDNVLSPGFLAAAVAAFGEDPRLGIAGGPVRPEFEVAPPPWAQEFYGLLALHDEGDAIRVEQGGPGKPWPAFAPVGAGLCVRAEAASLYRSAVAAADARRSLDRRGPALTSGGDSDLLLTAFHAGWSVGYFPELSLVHLIPAARLDPAYLARLNEGVQRSWVTVLALHGLNPWPAIPRWSVPLRSARAWLRSRAWTSQPARIRWKGLHGRFLGQSDLRPQR